MIVIDETNGTSSKPTQEKLPRLIIIKNYCIRNRDYLKRIEDVPTGTPFTEETGQE